MNNKGQLLSEKPTQTHDEYAWTVYTTWQMSFDKLSQPAAMFLQLCSFLHQDGILEEIFSRAATYTFPSSGPSEQELQKPLKFLSQFLGCTGEWDSLCFLKITNEIKAYSLMTFDAKRKLYSIHPLVHNWSQSTLTDQESYYYITSAIVGMSIAEIQDQDLQLTSLKMLPHINSLMLVSKELAPGFSAQYGMIYYYAGRYEEAKELELEILEKRRKLFGDDHPDTIHAMHRLAITYDGLGQFKQAEDLKVVVLEQKKRKFGNDHLETLHAMHSLAVTYDKLSQFQRAEELHITVYEKRRKLLGDGHPDTLRAMHSLAVTYDHLGQFQKAKELQVVVLEKQIKLCGNDHPATLQAMHNLATTYHRLGQFKAAEEL
jgi:tetratricopeptide (TPR) repeat protein